MVLLGPATEAATYILLAPAVVLALIEGFSEPLPSSMRCILVTSFALLLISSGLNSFSEFNRFPFNIFQPVGGLFFSIYAIMRLVNSSLWNEETAKMGSDEIDGILAPIEQASGS